MHFPVGYRNFSENYSYSTAKPAPRENHTNAEDRMLARRGNSPLI